MKQIFCGIVTLTLYIGCLGFPANLETSVLTNESDIIINKNSTEMELKKLSNTEESEMMQIKILENSNNQDNEQKLKEKKSNNKDKLTIEEMGKTEENKTNDKEKIKKEEDHKFIDSPKDVTQEEITKQSQVWKDFENDFSLFEQRLPDLTEEEFIELNKEGAIPWNFLKSVDIKRNISEENPKPVPIQTTPIYITIPIIINSHSTLPISLTIAEQNVNLKLANHNSGKDLNVSASNVKVLNGNIMVSPTLTRQTNRHRSNIRSKIYARNNNNKVQAFDYSKDNYRT